MILVNNLSYDYMKGTLFEKKALKDINIQIGKGEFLGIAGATGSGKSTLIQHFNGLLKPSHGKVFVNGVDTENRGFKEIRNIVGIVFQYPEHQLFGETVYEDIAFGLKAKKIITSSVLRNKKRMQEKENEANTAITEIDSRIRYIIKLVGLSENILNRSPFELSWGEKRKIAIAGTLVLNPEVLILDEPTAGLDPFSKKDIFNVLRNYNKNHGTTIIVVSHDIEDILKEVDRIIVMDDGCIFLDIASREICKHVDLLESKGFLVPQITYLMRKLKAIIPEINDEVITLADAKFEIMKYIGKIDGLKLLKNE